jgi:hypothetical protein
MVIAVIKLGIRLVRLVSVAYTVLASVLVVVEVVQSLGPGGAETKLAKQAEKTRKRKQAARLN